MCDKPVAREMDVGGWGVTLNTSSWLTLAVADVVGVCYITAVSGAVNATKSDLPTIS